MSASRITEGHDELLSAVRRWGRYVLLAAICVLLLFQLVEIGWFDVLQSLPETPYFYLLFLGLYLALPVSEVAIYALIWPIRRLETFAALLKKRVVNKDVLGYAGEFYFVLWTSKSLGRPKREVAGIVKDNALLSFATMTGWTIALLCFLLVTGQFEGLLRVELSAFTVVAAVVPLVVIGVVIILRRFRRAIFSLPARTLLKMGALHGIRVLVVAVLQVAQWAVVIPEVSLSTWLIFLSAQVVVSRLPFLPARDLIFAGVGIELTRHLGIPTAPAAAMLLVSSVLDKSLNFLLFSLLSVRKQAPEPA